MQRTIQHRLYQSFETNKDRPAIEYGSMSLTYAALDQQTDALAQHIVAHYGQGAIIGVLLQDRLDAILTMIGILKAGCVFMPLESAFPYQRLNMMLEAIDVRVTISDDQTIAQFQAEYSAHEVVTLQAIKDAQPLSERPDVGYTPADRVYVYHTSGSTGKPKAIVGKNMSLLHFITWELKTFNIDHTFRCSQFTNVGFDVFLRDTLMPLCAGACLCIPEDTDIVRNSPQLTQWIADQRISLIHCVPSVFALIDTERLDSESYPHLKYILLAGEKVRPERLRRWFSVFGSCVQLVNLYGPTETTLAKAYYLIQEEDQDRKVVPIGKPIEGAQLLLLNQDLHLCDVFKTGEIYIRTPFMSYGYYETHLNNERFVANPLADDPDNIVYKTGDLARSLPDGNIELLGRVDRQIKIRGMRVDLEEIEYNLVQHPLVEEAVVISREVSETNQMLGAYVTLNTIMPGHDDTLVSSIMADLMQRLPQYMLPAYLIVLHEIPRKINGKIDYSALQDPLADPLHHVEPHNPIEYKLLDIWKEVLAIDTISVDDSFFEKGGNSLNLMNLILRISEEFQVEMNLEQLALENTIERQATFIMNMATVQ